MEMAGSAEALDRVAATELGHAYLELKRQYENLVSRNLAGMFRTTVDGRFLECNDAMAHMLGYPDRDALLNHSAQDVYFSHVERERFLEVLFRERRLTNFELVLKHRNGRAVHVIENVFVDEGEGRITTIQGSFIDITAFRQSHVEQASLMTSYRSLVEHIRDGLLVVLQEQVTYANPAADAMMGRTLTGSSVRSLFTKNDGDAVCSMLDRVLQDAQEPPLPVHLNNRTEQEVLLFATAVRHEGERAVQLTLQDQTVQQGLLEERIRLKMAEEVNHVLREEIAQHRRTQEELRHSRRFLRSLVNSSLDMIMAADPEGHITEYNPAATLRFGWEAEEIKGLNTQLLYADPEQYKAIQRELEEHGVYTGEVLNKTRDGEVFTSFIAASRLYDEDGQLLGAMGVSRDVTRMKRDQEVLKASEECYRDLFENATDLIQSVDSEGRFQYVNKAWRNTLGYTEEELAQLTFFDVIHPEHLAHCKQLFDRILGGEHLNEVRTAFKAKDGRKVYVEGATNIRRLEGRPDSTRSIFRDVTLVQAARERVKEHEAKWRALFESSEHMFWTVDRSIKLTSYNKGYGDVIERLYGQRPEINTDQERPRKLFASAEYHAFWQAKYEQAFTGVPVRFETDVLDPQGRRVCNEIFLGPVFGPDGQVAEVFGVGHEITEQKLAEDLVREQAARLQAIFDSSANMMIWTLDRDLCITSCNEHFIASIEEAHGIRFRVGAPFVEEMSKRVARGEYKALVARFKAALDGKPQQFEAELVSTDGRSVWVENFLNPIVVDGQIREISCQAYGITDRKEAQRELMRSLAEKEVLLKEVHHRVKNNLQIVSSIMSLQSAHVGDDERLLDLLHHSRDRIRSMSLIHESLYQHKDFSSVDLGSYIDGLARNLVMSYSLHGKVDLEMQLAPTSLVLDQAIPCGLILNELISNALKHAYPQEASGKLNITLELHDDTVKLTVADDGVGLPPNMDPLQDGNLGLELVRTLVDQLDGQLRVNSGTGVTYLLTFERIKHSSNGADERPRSGG